MHITMDDVWGSGFLGALRLSDSALPTGLFTQSHSLEAFVQSGRVRKPADVSELLTDILVDQVAPSDSVAVALAWQAGAAHNMAVVVQVDRALHATKLCQEMREGSRRSGGRLLSLGTALSDQVMLAELQANVASALTPGHYAAVFGVLSQAMHIPMQAAVAAELYSFASSFLGAAMRLLRFDHMDTQRTLHDLEPTIWHLAVAACQKNLCDIRSFSPLVDVMSMHHEHGRMRLFSS